MDLLADMEFALSSGEFDYRGGVSLTRAMRYVAAINPECSRAEFTAILGAKYNRETLGIQFTQSRKFSLEDGQDAMLPSGALVPLPPEQWNK